MKNTNSKEIWILGAGKFGRKAVNTLLEAQTKWSITVVDRDPERLNNLAGVDCVCSDGVEWLQARFPARSPNPEMIVPALPIHVAAEWLQRALQQRGIRVRPTDLPGSYLQSLPNPVIAGGGRAYTSFAEFMCPESCDEPEGYCRLSGEKRTTPLFELLKTAEKPGFTSLVVRSYQLSAGVGGIHSAHLCDLLDSSIQNQKGMIIVGTACRCHGVVDCLQIG